MQALDTFSLVELETGRQDWAAAQCGCGAQATHVVDDLRWLNAGGDGNEFIDTQRFAGHVYDPSLVYEPGVLVVKVALAALASDVPIPVRRIYSALLLYCTSSEAQPHSAVNAGRDLIAECLDVARGGIWLLYAEIFSGRNIDTASNAYETLALVEVDQARLARVQEVAADLLPWHLRPGALS